MAPFVETKHHVNKATQTYVCDVLKRSEDWVVLKYVSTQSWEIVDTVLPVGTCTLAYYEVGASWVVWRMSDSEDHLLGHLFHVCRDITLFDNGVDYLDLLLDVWVGGEGEVTLLDEDELAHCVISKKLTITEALKIEKQAQILLETYQHWIDRFQARLLGLGS